MNCNKNYLRIDMKLNKFFHSNFTKNGVGFFLIFWILISCTEKKISCKGENCQSLGVTISPTLEAPKIATPNQNPYQSSDTTLTLTGSCPGGTVEVTGAEEQSVPCVNGYYSITLTKPTDGDFDFILKTISPTGATSIVTKFHWVRNSSLPATPTINLPGSITSISKESTLLINGTCTSGNQVSMTGDESGTTSCIDDHFEFTVTRTIDSNNTFNITQTDPTTKLTSGAVTLFWKRDTVPPITPILTSSLNIVNSQNSILITGLCEESSTVLISGSGNQSVLCTDSTFSYSSSKPTDGSYTYNISQTDLAGNISPNSVVVNWIRDTVAPSALTLTNPPSSLIANNETSLTLSGSCESGNFVSLMGDSSSTVTCTNNLFSFTGVTKSTDGTYNFILHQTDLAQNQSTLTSVTWVRDTTVPASPVLNYPSTSSFTSSDSTLTLSGVCETGATVSISGDYSTSTSCSSGVYSIPITKNTDGTYNFNLTQTDAVGNSSSPTHSATPLEWIRNTSLPSTPSITSPSNYNNYSTANSFTLSGTCTSGFTVELSGDSGSSTTCSNSAYSFIVNKTIDGTFVFNVRQKNNINVYSATSSVSWVRDTTAPVSVVITSPVSSPVSSNASSLTITGSCEGTNSIMLAGDVTSPLTTTCSTGTFSFIIPKTVDGTFTFNISQSDLSGNGSTPTTFVWIRDATAPNVITLTYPTVNPYSLDMGLYSYMSLNGSCEPNALISITQASTTLLSQTCPSDGNFSIYLVPIESVQALDYQIFQSDAAGNQSVSLSQSINTIAATTYTPEVGNPYFNATTNVTTFNPMAAGYTNTSQARFTVKCKTGIIGYIAFRNGQGIADIYDGNNSVYGVNWLNSKNKPVPCVPHSTNLRVAYIDVIYRSVPQTNYEFTGAFEVYETSDNTYVGGMNGTFQRMGDTNYLNFSWTYDSIVPSAPVITSIPANPYQTQGGIVVSGTCENQATVSISPRGASNDPVVCQNNEFSFSLLTSEWLDLPSGYSINVKQTDRGGNISANASFTWIKDSTSAPPLTTTHTEVADVDGVKNWTTNTDSTTLSGICVAGYQVVLSGDVVAGDITAPSANLTQTCPSNQLYSFTIAKSGSTTGTSYYFELLQTDGTLTSTPIKLRWTRDTVGPAINLTMVPPSTNYNYYPQIKFTLGENVLNSDILINIDNNTPTACVEGTCTTNSGDITLSNISNGNHTYTIAVSDSAGNTTTATTSWTQLAFKTLALYHFNNDLTDSSLFAGQSLAAPLSMTSPTYSAGSTTSGVSPKAFASGSSYTAGQILNFASGNSISATSTAALNQTKNYLTGEGYFKIGTVPSVVSTGYGSTGTTNVNCWELISKDDGTNGWQFNLCYNFDTNSSGKMYDSYSLKKQLYYLELTIRNNGTLSRYISSRVPSNNNGTTGSVSASTGIWYYYGFNFAAGNLSFYYSTTTSGSNPSIITSAFAVSETSINQGTANLKIANSTSLISGIEEVRVSQDTRTLPLAPSSTSIMTTPWTAD